MAKSRAPSKRSRAARRATSPGIDTDKSLKEITPPRATVARPSVLDVHQSAGVQKRVKKGRKSQMTAKARRRHEKGLEMAEAINERTQAKVEKSKGRGRTVQNRSRAWDAINRAAEEAQAKDNEEVVPGEDDDDNDADMGGNPADGAKPLAADSKTPLGEENAAPAPVLDDDLDEIL